MGACASHFRLSICHHHHRIPHAVLISHRTLLPTAVRVRPYSGTTTIREPSSRRRGRRSVAAAPPRRTLPSTTDTNTNAKTKTKTNTTTPSSSSVVQNNNNGPRPCSCAIARRRYRPSRMPKYRISTRRGALWHRRRRRRTAAAAAVVVRRRRVRRRYCCGRESRHSDVPVTTSSNSCTDCSTRETTISSR